MEDIRLGRKTAPVPFQFIGNPVTWTKIAEQDPNRTAVDLAMMGGGFAVAVFSSSLPTVAVNFPALAELPRITLDVQHHGNIVTQPLYLITDGTNMTVVGSFAVLKDQ